MEPKIKRPYDEITVKSSSVEVCSVDVPTDCWKTNYGSRQLHGTHWAETAAAPWPTQSYDLTESNIDTVRIKMILDNNNDPVDEEELPEAEGMEEDDMDAEEEEMTEDEAAEFSLLNQQLDQLDQALDAIEQKNDSIHSQLRELLQESKQARLEIEAEAKKQW